MQKIGNIFENTNKLLTIRKNNIRFAISIFILNFALSSRAFLKKGTYAEQCMVVIRSESEWQESVDSKRWLLTLKTCI